MIPLALFNDVVALLVTGDDDDTRGMGASKAVLDEELFESGRNRFALLPDVVIGLLFCCCCCCWLADNTNMFGGEGGRR